MFLDVLRIIASSLQTPVVVLLIALVVVMVVIVGMLIAEVFTERLQFKVSLPRLVDDLRNDANTEEVIERSDLLRRQKDALLELLAHPSIDDASRESLAVNLVSKEQEHFDIRVKVTDTIAKVAPMLGLMGTLIPLGPGLIAIGEGDTAILSESLLIAFDTTILGLIVAAVALVVSVIRKTWYAKYMAAFEAAAECTLQIANERGELHGGVSTDQQLLQMQQSIQTQQAQIMQQIQQVQQAQQAQQAQQVQQTQLAQQTQQLAQQVAWQAQQTQQAPQGYPQPTANARGYVRTTEGVRHD